MQNPELKEYNLGGIKFYIPVNAAGEELPEFVNEEDYEEAERFNRWFEQAQESDIRNQQNKL